MKAYLVTVNINLLRWRIRRLTVEVKLQNVDTTEEFLLKELERLLSLPKWLDVEVVTWQERT